MPDTGRLSEAKRTLLEKYLRGELTASTGATRQQPRKTDPQAIASGNGEGNHQATSKGELVLPVASFASDISEHSDDIDQIGHQSNFKKVIDRILHLLSRFGPGGYTLRPFLHRL